MRVLHSKRYQRLVRATTEIITPSLSVYYVTREKRIDSIEGFLSCCSSPKMIVTKTRAQYCHQNSEQQMRRRQASKSTRGLILKPSVKHQHKILFFSRRASGQVEPNHTMTGSESRRILSSRASIQKRPSFEKNLTRLTFEKYQEKHYFPAGRSVTVCCTTTATERD